MSNDPVFGKVGMFIKDDEKPKVKISRISYASGYPETLRLIDVFYKDNDSEIKYGTMEETDFLKKVTTSGGRKRNTKKNRRNKRKKSVRRR